MPGRLSAVTRAGRRAVPVAVEAYRRWQQLSPQEKERYKQRVRSAYAQARRR
jgi:hypothetical protein